MICCGTIVSRDVNGIQQNFIVFWLALRCDKNHIYRCSSMPYRELNLNRLPTFGFTNAQSLS